MLDFIAEQHAKARNDKDVTPRTPVEAGRNSFTFLRRKIFGKGLPTGKPFEPQAVKHQPTDCPLKILLAMELAEQRGIAAI